MQSGLIALFIAQFIGGSFGPLFVKVGTSQIPPFMFTACRFLVATIIFLPIFIRKNNLRKFPKKDVKNIFVNSFFFFLNATFFGVGIQYTTVIMSQILYCLVPVVVFVFAYFFQGEKITKQKIIGLLVSGFGAIFLIQQSFNLNNSSSFGTPIGNLLVFMAVFAWSLYFVFSKELQKKYTSETITFFNFAISSALFIFVIPFEMSIRPLIISKVNIFGVGSVFGTGILLSVVMISLIQYGIKKTSAFSASLFQYMGPLFAFVSGIIFFSEKITLNLVFGAFIIIIGVFYGTSFHIFRKYIKSVLQ